MRKVAIYSTLLFIGLGLSQVMPAVFGESYDALATAVRVLTMTGLAFIMIHVGSSSTSTSRTSAVMAGTTWCLHGRLLPLDHRDRLLHVRDAAVGLWSDADAWKETLLAGRFAAPTSAGVLFSMLAAAGLGATWLFRKARILAIFDDLDTVLLMIPLKMLMVGVAWQLGFIVLLMAALLAIGFVWLHRWRLPVTGGWVLFYAAVIVAVSEFLYAGSKIIDRPCRSTSSAVAGLRPGLPGAAPRPWTRRRSAEVEHALHGVLERPREKRTATIVSAAFMVFVGSACRPSSAAAASMPNIPSVDGRPARRRSGLDGR